MSEVTRILSIPVPLKRGDPEVNLDLQSAFTTVYDRARYGLSLDYSRPRGRPFSEPDAEWAKQLIERRGSSASSYSARDRD